MVHCWSNIAAGGLGDTTPMKSWWALNVTIHASTMVDACNVASLYLHNFKKCSPRMGHVNQFNLDIDPIILLEITGTQGLNDPQGGKSLTLDPHGRNDDCKCDVSLAPYKQ